MSWRNTFASIALALCVALAGLVNTACPPQTTPPTAAFSATPTTGPVPLEVTFTDESTAGSSAITAWAWDFGDSGTKQQSTEQNPVHTYEEPGTYPVSLTVTTADGTDTETKTDFITVQPRQLEIVLSSSNETDVTTNSDMYTASGLVLVLDGGSFPSAINFTITNGESMQTGTAAVNAAGEWSANLSLMPGENVVVFTAQFSDAMTTFRVTYNPNLAFAGQLALTPDIVYVNEPRQITAMIAITDPNVDPAAVVLIDADAAEPTALVSLSDDGNLANGDEIEGDGIFTAIYTVAETEAGAKSFRVQAGVMGGGTALSERATVLVDTHLSDEELNTILTSQADLQAQLEAAAKLGQKQVDTVVDQIVATLEADEMVADVGENDSGRGVWVVYENGVAGVLYAPADDVRGGGISPAAAQMAGTAPVAMGAAEPVSAYEHYIKNHTLPWFRKDHNDNKIKSTKAIGIAQAFPDFGNCEVLQSMPILQMNCFDTTTIQVMTDGTGSVESFKNLGDYGIIMISSHGDSFYNGILSLWSNKFGWNGPFGQVVLFSNQTVTNANKATYEDDLKTGRLVIWGTFYGVMPTFITKYAGSLPNSIVWMGICRGAFNGTLANAFLSRGAAAYLSFTDYVSVSWPITLGVNLINGMLMDDQTLADNFTAGQVDPVAGGTAVYTLFGTDTISINVEGLQDGSFESNSVTQAWTVAGDGRIIPALGASTPTDGAYMGIISTGLGFTTQTGTISQEFCIGENASMITFDWNFFSEEFLEYVGSQFQDAFTATLTNVQDGGAPVTIVNETIDSLAGGVTAVSNSFDRGDVYATGWRTSSAAVPEEFRGKRVKLEFFTTDVGDSIYDTAVLLDNIVVTGEGGKCNCGD